MDNLYSLPEIERQAALYVQYIKGRDITTLRFWPLKKTASAHSNRTRRGVLEALLGYDYNTGGSLNTLEYLAKNNGYKIETVNPNDWS